MPRAIVLLMDSFGIGASLDAEQYGDKGADTFGNIAKSQATPLNIPNLTQLGLTFAHLSSTGQKLEVFDYPESVSGQFGYAVEQSIGKDTPSGHWEIAGLPVMSEWGLFPKTIPTFPDELIKQFIQRCQLQGILGNKHASGTTILDELGEQHLQTGHPICYTSGDSVFQIAAHEEYFGLQRLYECCEIARELVDDYNVGRVIARPFIGKLGEFKRTANRRDYATPPPGDTLLDILKRDGREVIAIGKTADIFAHRGITQSIKGDGNDDLFSKTLEALQSAPEGSLIFTNFVDFDSKYGHRRNVEGYARAIEAFDVRLVQLQACLKADDYVIITADHGCDPTQPGSDHTREHIPVIGFGPNISAGPVGRRETFADIGQSIANHLQCEALDHGVSF